MIGTDAPTLVDVQLCDSVAVAFRKKNLVFWATRNNFYSEEFYFEQ